MLPKIMRAWDAGRNKIRYLYKDSETNRTKLGEDHFEWYFFVKENDFVKNSILFALCKEKGWVAKYEKENDYIKVFVNREHNNELLNKNCEWVWEYKDRSLFEIKKLFSEKNIQTYEMDLLPYRRWVIDNDIQYESNLKVLMLDIETDDEKLTGKVNPETCHVLSCAFLDFNTKKEVWICAKDRSEMEEKILLEKIAKVLVGYDVLCAWNGRNFDFPVLKRRMLKYGIIIDWRKLFLQDHMEVYKKLGPSLPSYSLDFVSKMITGEGKVDHEQKIFQMFLYNRSLLKEYNIVDVRSMANIETKTHFLEVAREVNVIGKCECDDVYISRKIDNLMLRRAYERKHFHFKTKVKVEINDDDEDSFEGAYVFPPVFGIHKNVKVCDFHCLVEGTKIDTMDRGIQNIENINIGDRLQGIGGVISKVKTFEKFQKNELVYKITLKNGLTITTTSDHKFPVVEVNEQGERITKLKSANHLSTKDKLFVPKQYLNLRKDIDDAELYEFLAIFMCEGSYFEKVRKHQSRDCMVVQSQCWITIVKFEEEFKQRISYLLDKMIEKYNFPANYEWISTLHKNDIQGSWRVKFTQKGSEYYHFIKDVISWFKNKLELLNTDSFLMNENNLKGFLHGMLESDANVNTCRSSVVVPTTEQLRADIYDKVFSRLGIPVNHAFVKCENRNPRHMFEIIYPDAIKKLHSIHRFVATYKQIPFDEVSKKENYGRSKCYHKCDWISEVKSIEKIQYNGYVYNIGMENQQYPYYIANGIITKNCLYPSVIQSFNLSPDTIIEDKDLDKFPYENVIRPPTGYHFRKDIIGIIPEIIMEISDKRNRYKKLMKECVDKNTMEYKTYDRLAYVFKFFALSFYGVMGLKTSRFYDSRIAETTTLGGQYFTKTIAKFLESMGHPILAGDTDSLFIRCDSKERILQLLEKINSICSDHAINQFNCKESHLSMDYDKAFSKLLLLKAKKRYAGYLNYLDGKEIPEQLYVKGLEYVRTDSCKLLKTKQKAFIEKCLNGELSQVQMKDEVLKLRNYVLYELNDIEEIKIAQKLTKEVEDYKSYMAHLQVVEALRASGIPIYVGDKVEYFIEALNAEGKPIPKSTRFWKGKFERIYFWTNKLYPPIERVLESAFPNENWKALGDFGSAKKMASTKQGRMDLWSKYMTKAN